MPSPYHFPIAIVHSTMSALHCICILLMLGGSVWQRSLAFTPWSSCIPGSTNGFNNDRTTSSALFRSFSKAYTKITTPCGVCGVKGEYFYVVLISRELVETALQTVQAYRMSLLLPRMLLNRFYVTLLAVNCWSSVIIHSFLLKRDEGRRRFTCIVLDCVLDLMACMGVEIIVVLSYVGQYDPKILGFPEIIWYNDEWVARALNEFQMVLVVSWWDLASRAIFSLGLVMTTASMKTLLWQLPAEERILATNDHLWSPSISAVSPMPPIQACRNVKDESTLNQRQMKMRFRVGKLLQKAVHTVFACWGMLILGLHIQASLQPTLPQCLMQVRPWGVTRPSCYLVGLDCYRLGIEGRMIEVEEKWSEFDSSTVVQLLIRHCSALEMPTSFTEFHGQRNIKIYNTTILEWAESAATTNTNHPAMTSLMIVRVNMTDGLLPKGFQSVDFPQTLYDFEYCVTSLRALPDDLDTKWSLYSIIQLEYSQLTTVTPVLTLLEPYYLALTGNPITEIPPEVFEVQGMLYLGISNTRIKELPRNVDQLSAVLSWIFVIDTDISFFWLWVDELIERMKDRAAPWIASGSPYCNDLKRIRNGTATTFTAPLLPEYSQILMNSTEDNLEEIDHALRCDEIIEGLFYPLAYEDKVNAISDPPMQ